MEVYQREASGLFTLVLWTGLAYGFSENEGPLSGVPLLTCALFACTKPWGCSRGMAPGIPALTGFLCVVHLNWQPRGGGGGSSLPVCHAPCQCAVFPHCPPCPLVPASMQVCREEHGSTCRELFLPFTICNVTKMAFQPQGRQILVQSGCPAVNHCVRAMQAVVWSMLVASSNSTGREWTAGLFPSDALPRMLRATHGGKCHGCPWVAAFSQRWQHPAYCFAVPNSGWRLCSQLLNTQIILKEPVL